MDNEIARKRTYAPKQWMQVWGIVLNGGFLLQPIDDDNCDCFMGFPTEADAIQGLRSQIEKGFVEAGSGQVQRLA